MRIIPLPRNLTRTVLLSGWRPGTIGYIMENTDGNDETLYLYYRTPLEEGGQTAPILKGLRIAESITNEYANKGIFLDVQVDAVQVSESERARQDAF